MSDNIAIQIISEDDDIPEQDNILKWINAAIINDYQDHEICVRIVDEAESQALNRQYRKKDKPTNVLSFPYHDELDDDILEGDIIICAPIVVKEAVTQNKSIVAHWAHLVVHGCLHLQGYDHEIPEDADIMEKHEIDILAKLGFNNPYQSLTE